VLRVPETKLGDDLGALAGFDSYRLVELIDALEGWFAIEFAAADLVPENLYRLSAISDLVARTRSTRVPVGATHEH
jgi:acyl carrier protein